MMPLVRFCNIQHFLIFSSMSSTALCRTTRRCWGRQASSWTESQDVLGTKHFETEFDTAVFFTSCTDILSPRHIIHSHSQVPLPVGGQVRGLPKARGGLLPGAGCQRWDSENRRTASEKLVPTTGQRGEKRTGSPVVQRELVQTCADVHRPLPWRGVRHTGSRGTRWGCHDAGRPALPTPRLCEGTPRGKG